ncbi:GNAT family N-acetyltransferase [Deinococcus multiflagellatus]|uniref:GNAT family N-acetyltransferase n=1 Tax=Deinococcus multiflagellatus TaxID=1656887 RepID=A0ABW1ZMV8_9DEIO|nr:GNAT family N-acetyltransferase [Deinococcus multiflagellatus]MBZ9715169.1 GNAT family N-acetyltransferase [Deinococcus multiflagellatus]
MNDWTIETARPDALHETVALLPDRADAERRLEIIRGNVAAGRLRPEQVQLLRSPRGLEGVCIIPTAPHIPLLPRLRADVPEPAAQAFLAHLRAQVTDRRLILDSTQGPLCLGAAQAAGWHFEEEAVVYTTDLTAGRWSLDPQAQLLDHAAVALPEVQALLGALNRAAFALPDGWTLVGLPDASGALAALGATGPGGRPGTASIDLIGVHPGARGQGLGRRLHAHLLALAARDFSDHAGATDANNHPMRRIFEGHGAVLAQQQLIFTSP